MDSVKSVIPISSGGIKVSELTKHYYGRPVLDRVSFTIDPGSVFALCGSSGAGKSTLARFICGLLAFDKGWIEVEAGSTGTLTTPCIVRAEEDYPRQLLGRIGVVFQDHNLFPHMTIVQNITFVLRHTVKLSRAEAEERAMYELDRVGLADKYNEYPVRLSGGERRRAALARALAIDPVLLLLDEPTSNLDPSMIGDVLTIIRQISLTGTTMLLITHNIRFARAIGNGFGVLDRGKLETSNEPDLLAKMESDWS